MFVLCVCGMYPVKLHAHPLLLSQLAFWFVSVLDLDGDSVRPAGWSCSVLCDRGTQGTLRK